MTTVAPSQRTREDWEELAEKLLPSLQEHGGITPEVRSKYGIGYVYGLKMALAKKGFNIHGQPLQVKPIAAKRPDAVAKHIANRRKKGEPYWLLEVESGMTHHQMTHLLREHGYALSGEAVNGHN